MNIRHIASRSKRYFELAKCQGIPRSKIEWKVDNKFFADVYNTGCEGSLIYDDNLCDTVTGREVHNVGTNQWKHWFLSTENSPCNAERRVSKNAQWS